MTATADSSPVPLIVDGGITIAVDTAAVRRLAGALQQVTADLDDADAAVVGAGRQARVQLLASAALSPVSALRVHVVLTDVAIGGMLLNHAWAQLACEVGRVASAYDEAEGRAGEHLRGGSLYHHAIAALATWYAPRTAHVGPVRELAPRAAPSGIADLANWFEGYQHTDPGGPGRIDVIERTVPTADDRSHTAYTVLLPGTSSWGLPDMEAQVDDTRNVSANLLLISNQDTAEVRALPEALARAGVPTGAQLTLVGHSQGGMTAIAAANSPAIRSAYRVRHVITFGSPVARMPAPPDVAVLSVENRRDPVPSLDLKPNQATPRHVTVQAGSGSPGWDGKEDHPMPRYLPAARQVDASTHPSLVAFDRDLRRSGVLAPAGRADRGEVRVRRVETTLDGVATSGWARMD